MAAKKVAPVAKPPSPAVEAKVAELLKLNAKLRKAQAAVKVIADEETAMREDLVALYGKNKVESVNLKAGRVGIVRTYYANVVDLDAVIKFSKTKGNDDLVRLSLNTSAWNERRKDGKTIPGVEEAYREDLRVSPAKAATK